MTRIGWREVAFLGICLVQLAVPGRWLMQSEAALERGEVFRFQCAPVDPVDVLRGRYVRLGFEEQRASLSPNHDVERGEEMFVRIETGPDGFAHLGMATRTPPAGAAYLKVRVLSLRGDEAVVALPFERYYMEEKKAPGTEQAYRQGVASGSRDTFVSVRVLDGTAVLEELYVSGVAAGDLIE